MVRANAGRVPAGVDDLHVIWDRTMDQLPGDAMRAGKSSMTELDVAVALPHSSRPLPAVPLLLNLAPKSFW